MNEAEVRGYRDIVKEKSKIEKLLKDIEQSNQCASTSNIEGAPHGSPQGSGSAQERRSDNTWEIRERYRDIIRALNTRQLQIEQAIEQMVPVHRQLIRHRFIEGLTLAQTAREMGYSTASISRHQRAALDSLNEGGAEE